VCSCGAPGSDTDLIILDAYVQGRYGSAIPQHLATKEFFELAREHLTTNGVVAYNVIGTLKRLARGHRGGDLPHAQHGVPAGVRIPCVEQPEHCAAGHPIGGQSRFERVAPGAPLTWCKTAWSRCLDSRVAWKNSRPCRQRTPARSPVLTDDYAPVEGLAGGGGKT